MAFQMPSTQKPSPHSLLLFAALRQTTTPLTILKKYHDNCHLNALSEPATLSNKFIDMTAQAKTPQVHIDDLHFEHKSWAKELDFFKGEIEFFKKRLAEVAVRYSDKEVLKGIEHFQNQFYIQGNHIEELGATINKHELELADYAKENPIAIDHVRFPDHLDLRARIETNRDIINELKKEYQRYLSKWM